MSNTTHQNAPKLRFPEFNEEWKKKRLSDLAARVMAKNGDGSISRVLTNSAVDGIVNQTDYFDKDIANQNNLSNYYIVSDNDFVYNPRISNAAPVGPIKRNHIGTGVMSPLYTVFRFTEGNLGFFERYFETKFWHHYMGSIANFGARHDRMNVTISDFENMPLPFPHLNEQQKIADFLTAVDEKIEKLRRKKELLEDYKKGVMQQIFSQTIRFKDGDGEGFPDWEEKTLGDMFEERSERGAETLELLSVTMNNGVVKRSDIEGKNNSSDDKSNYKKVCIHDIAYNSMRMWQGASGVSQFEGIVSPAYTVLKPTEKCVPQYFGYLFKTKTVIQIFQRNSQGLTSDTWNLKYPQLSKIKFKTPTPPEQQKIADFLSDLDTKIEAITNQLTHAQTFKKGLLQQMFV